MSVIGIDLAGKPKNPSGIAVLNDNTIVKEVYTDIEIMRVIEEYKPKVIAIDAPFSLPKDGMWRPSDYELRSEGYSVLSPKFPTMQMLVRRAMELVKTLRKKYKVIEVFPRATEEILALDKITVERKLDRIITKDEYDAFLCALTANAYLEKKVRILGSAVDINDQIVVPEKE